MPQKDTCAAEGMLSDTAMRTKTEDTQISKVIQATENQFSGTWYQVRSNMH